MDGLLLNVILVLVFVLIGGVFAASEIALVSLRDGQVKAMAARGGAGLVVERLTADSNRFLSAVQVGVTLAGFFSASYGAATIAPYVSPLLIEVGLPEKFADTGAFVAVTLVVSYLSLVFGELVPKRLAMQTAESFALVAARPLDAIATVMRPVIWLLGASTDLVMRLLRRDPEDQKETMDAAELRNLVAEHDGIGSDERLMVVDILTAGDRTIGEVMTPRTEVDFLDADLPVVQARDEVRRLERSRYPVRGADADDILGFLHVRDLVSPQVDALRVGDLVREILVMPDSKHVFSALAAMREHRVHVALVVDEYGGTDGIVTLEDLVEEFVGEIEDEYDTAEPVAIVRPESREISGLLGRGEVAKTLGADLPEGPFDTIAGLIVHLLGRLPVVGDTVDWADYTLTVTALDRRRIDRIEVRRSPAAAAAAAAAAAETPPDTPPDTGPDTPPVTARGARAEDG